MPKYRYYCTKCDSVFTKEKHMDDPHPKKCPDCGGKLERIFPETQAISFKGSGYYSKGG